MSHLAHHALENFPRNAKMFNDAGIMASEWHVWFAKLLESVPKMTPYTFTLDPGNILAHATNMESVTLTGLSTQDIIVVNKPAYISGVIIEGVCSVANRLDITFANITALAINPGSATYSCYAFRL